MSAQAIAKALGARRAGAAWMALCPAHEDREPSLSIANGDDGKVLLHCHAGCEQLRVIGALRARGLWDGGEQQSNNKVGSLSHAIGSRERDKARTQAALRLWGTTVAAAGSLIVTYLAARSITVPVPDVLRFHAAVKHPAGQRWPAMVALVTRGADGAPMAVHRTFLARDGRTKSPIEPNKMMLGPCRGGAIRLGSARDRLMIAEGIETALSAMQATSQPAWAALSTSGLRALELPADVREVIVLADGDAAGERAALDAALRWKYEGRRVSIAHAPRGFDFNDVLRGGPLCPGENAA
jgi:putative DNA primase/helicase